MKINLKRYEYTIKEKNGKSYKGSYTIKEDVKPLGYEDERLVQKFAIDYIDVEAELLK